MRLNRAKGSAGPTSTTNVRVRYAETDQMQVAYHAHYFTWFEIGRCELLRSLGQSYRTLEATGYKLPVIEAHCEYQAPALYDDQLEICTKALLISPVRVRFEYEVKRHTDRCVAASGLTVHAAINSVGKVVRLPREIRQLLT